jgi:hypothetical protein
VTSAVLFLADVIVGYLLDNDIKHNRGSAGSKNKIKVKS